MTREIKFRIWSNSYNKYIENYARTHEGTFGEGRYGYEGYHLALRPDGKLYDADVGIDYPGTWSEIPTLDWEDQSEDNEVELSTGLKDKNGKEIYEGDIISQTVLEGPRNGYYPNYEVFWDSEGCGWGLRDVAGDDGNDTSLSIFTLCGGAKGFLEKVEAIGNIHQNKELIKKEKEE